MATRRRYRRRYAGKGRDGRKLFWYRQVPFAMTVREVSTGTFSDIIFDEADYQNPFALINESRRGGPRIERILGTAGFSWVRNNGEVLPSGNGNFGLIVDSMLSITPDQVGTSNTSTAFDQYLENYVVLNYGCHDFSMASPGLAATECERTIYRFDLKPKRRIAEQRIQFATRVSIDLSSVDVLGYQAWAQLSLLVSTP